MSDGDRAVALVRATAPYKKGSDREGDCAAPAVAYAYRKVWPVTFQEPSTAKCHVSTPVPGAVFKAEQSAKVKLTQMVKER